MRTVTNITSSTESAGLMQRLRDRLSYKTINELRPNLETGGTLNKEGDTAFRMRVNTLLKENGIEANVAFGRADGAIKLGVDSNGRHIVTGDHPDKAKIEDLINNDEQLKQIKNAPAYAFGQKSESGGTKAAQEEQDSAYFSEEARLLYELRARSGEPAYASPKEETLDVMEWLGKRDSTKLTVDKLNEYIANGGELKIMTNTLEFADDQMSANPNFDFSNVGILQSGDMSEFMKARSWMETEVGAVLQKAGLDTSKLSGIKMSVRDNMLRVDAGQENLSEEDRLKIQAVLNAPANEELRDVIGRVLADEEAMSNTLQRATGLSLTDWAEVAKESGGNLANVDNEGMRKLFENDPDLASALGQLVGGTGIVGNAYLPGSAKEETEHAVSALGSALGSLVNGAVESTGMSRQEAEALKKNLVIEGDSSGNFKISGTNNQRFLDAVQWHLDHYTSGIFGDFLRRGSFLNQALGLGDAGEGVNFTMTFDKTLPTAQYAYGDGEKRQAQTYRW